LVLSGCKDEDYAKLLNSEGYKLYSSKCTSCHSLIPPQKHSIEKFKEYMERYGKGMTEYEKSKLEKFIEEAQK
jgi:recombinational DNA repair protein (RecF pathway)